MNSVVVIITAHFQNPNLGEAIWKVIGPMTKQEAKSFLEIDCKSVDMFGTYQKVQNIPLPTWPETAKLSATIKPLVNTVDL
jgi:hypothetical protein